MPGKRELMVRRGGAAAVGELSGGFFIRRMTSPGAVAAATAAAAARKRRLRRDSPTDNKENEPPWGGPRSRTRRSPLPEWYPRTPLRDITAIVRAIRRRDRSLRRATAAQQRTHEGTEPAPASPPRDTTTSPQEPSVSNEDTAPIHTIAPSDVSNTTSLTSPTEGLNSSPSPSPTSEPSSQTRSFSNDLSPAVNEKLSSLIDEMQRLVVENLRRTPPAAQPCKKNTTAATRRSSVLMSMR